MKKLSLILMALLLCVALVACGGGEDTTADPTVTDGPTVTDPSGTGPVTPGDDDTHTHTNKTLDAVASTCSKAGLTDGVVCTDCGKTVVAQVATPLAPHKYEGGKCTVCGAEAKASAGLKFIADGTNGYIVEAIGECTDAQVVIPSTHEGQPVIGIADAAFANNEAIVQVVIPASVKRIGNSAFERCVNLADVVMEEGIETIGEKAFMYCIALDTVVVPDSVTTIQTGAFMACYNLTEATLGAGLKKISNDVFFECYSLEVVDIMSKVEEIGGWAFFDCDLLTTITYAGSDADWNKIKFGTYWDENSGAYNVACAGGKSVHKHVYGDWYETGAKCEFARKCTKCSVVNTKLEHDVTNAEWEFTSEGVIQNCTVCDKTINGYMKNEVVLQIDFDKDVKEQIKDYPYFSLVGDGSNIALEKSGDRTAGHIKSVAWFDYDKKAFENLSYYSITFDMMVANKEGITPRDNSVVSFVPGYKNGAKAEGASVGWVWQLKYISLLDKVATKALNGTDVPYKKVEDIPDVSVYNDTYSAELKVGDWITIDIVCDIEARKSYVFADGKPIGSVGTFDYNDAKYKDAFSLRFCDYPSYGTRLDNFKIQAMTAD